MNRIRRRQIEKAILLMEQAQEILESAADEEEEYRDNMPENLQGSEKYEIADQAVEDLEYSMEAIGDAIDHAISAMGE